jgi:hypothetical protein
MDSNTQPQRATSVFSQSNTEEDKVSISSAGGHLQLSSPVKLDSKKHMREVSGVDDGSNITYSGGRRSTSFKQFCGDEQGTQLTYFQQQFLMQQKAYIYNGNSHELKVEELLAKAVENMQNTNRAIVEFLTQQ